MGQLEGMYVAPLFEPAKGTSVEGNRTERGDTFTPVNHSRHPWRLIRTLSRSPLLEMTKRGMYALLYNLSRWDIIAIGINAPGSAYNLYFHKIDSQLQNTNTYRTEQKVDLFHL